MRETKKLIQKTVKTEDPLEFDAAMQKIFEKATKSGKEPSVHFWEGMGLCATVTFYETERIPESAMDRFEAKGMKRRCFECEHYKPSADGRVKWVRCEKRGDITTALSPCCNIYYEELEAESELD